MSGVCMRDHGYGVGVVPIVGNKRRIGEEWENSGQRGKKLNINMKKKRRIRLMDEDGHHSDWRVFDSKKDNTLYLVRRTKYNPLNTIPIEITSQTAEDLKSGPPKKLPVKKEDLPKKLSEEDLIALYTAQALLALANEEIFKTDKPVKPQKKKSDKKKKNAKQSVPGVVTRSRNKSQSKQGKSSTKKGSKKSDSTS